MVERGIWKASFEYDYISRINGAKLTTNTVMDRTRHENQAKFITRVKRMYIHLKGRGLMWSYGKPEPGKPDKG